MALARRRGRRISVDRQGHLPGDAGAKPDVRVDDLREAEERAMARQVPPGVDGDAGWPLYLGRYANLFGER